MRKLKGVGSASPGCSSKPPSGWYGRQTRRRAGLEAAGAEAEGTERFAEKDAGGLAAAAGGIALFAAVDEAIEEGSGGDDGGAGEEVAAVAEFEAENAAMRTGITSRGSGRGNDGL